MKRRWDALCPDCGGLYSSQGLPQHQDGCDGELDPERDPELVDSDQIHPDLLAQLKDREDVDVVDGGVQLPPAQVLQEDAEDLEVDHDLPDDPEDLDEDGRTCGNCDGSEVLDADQALGTYREEADVVNRTVVRAFQGADWFCNDCHALGGGKFQSPRTLEEMFA